MLAMIRASTLDEPEYEATPGDDSSASWGTACPGRPEKDNEKQRRRALEERALRTISAGGVNTISAEEAALVPRRGR